MSDFSNTRSNYLKIMFGNLNERISNVVGSQNINAIGDTSFDTAALAMNQTNLIKKAEQKVATSGNTVQRLWDTIEETCNNVTEGFLNVIDSLFDLSIYTALEMRENSLQAQIKNSKGEELVYPEEEEKYKKIADYDWQAQFMKAMNQTSLPNIMNGDIFTEDHWQNWDAKSARNEIDDAHKNSLYTYLGEDTHNIINSVGQGVGYMIPTLAITAATGGGNLVASGVLGTTAFASATSEAYKESNDFSKSAGYGLANAAVEIGSEILVGKLLGKLGVGTGKIAGFIGKESVKGSSGFVKRMVKTMTEEGIEEAFAGILEPFAKSIYQGESAYKNDKRELVHFNKEFWVGGSDSISGQAITGGIVGGIFGGVSYAHRKSMLGKEGMQIADLLEQTHDLATKPSNKNLETISLNAAAITGLVNQVRKSGSKTHLDNIYKLLADPVSLSKAMQKEEVKAVDELINQQLNEMKDGNKYLTRNLFNELQDKFGTNFQLEFSKLTKKINAKINYKTKTITLNNELTDTLAPALVHEYIGHVIGNQMSVDTRKSIFEKVASTEWFQKNNSKLRKLYQSTKEYRRLSPIKRTKVWQGEVINSYIQSILKGNTNSESVKMISDVFLRNILLKKFSLNFKKNKDISLLKNNEILKEFSHAIDNLFGLTDKNVQRTFRKYLSGKKLTKMEENIYKKYKEIFDEVKFNDVPVEQYSKGEYNNIKKEERSNEFRRIQEESRRKFKKYSWRERSERNNETLRRRISDNFKRELDNRGYNPSSSNAILLKSNKGTSFLVYKNVDGTLFRDIFEISRTYLLNGELVDLHDDYNNATCYLSNDGLQGFAITKEGDLISVFNTDKSKKGFLFAISDIVRKNAKTLDCYASKNQNLQEIYSKIFHFKTASLMEYNMEYDHDSIAQNHNMPKVAFMVNTTKEINTRNFNKNQYDEAVAYQQEQVDLANKNNLEFKIDENYNYFKSLNVDIDQVRHLDGKIVEDENTKPLFEIARNSINISNEHLEEISKKIFSDMASKYGLSMDIGISNPSIKSVSSFAGRLYRNIKLGRGANQDILKDWIRGTFIFNYDNIDSIKSLLTDYKDYIRKIDVKDNDGYKGIHLNLNVDGIPVEIQLHTAKSWELKYQSDKYYDKYRSVNEKKLSQVEIVEKNKLENEFIKKWNHLLSNRDFNALRASVSESKYSISSSLGSNSIPNTGLTGEIHLPSTNSLRSVKRSLNSRLDGDNINSLISDSSSSNSISQQKENLKPYETNKAKEIKEGAQEKEGKVLSLKSASDVFDAAETAISKVVGKEFTIKGKKKKVRRLFEEYNISKNNAKKPNLKKFIVDILNQEVIGSSYIGDGSITYGEYLESKGIHLPSAINQGVDILFDVLNEKAIDSHTSKKIAKLETWLDKYGAAKKDFKAVMQFVKTLNGIKKVVGNHVSKYGNTGQIDLKSGIKCLFNSYFSKFRFTKGQYLSLANMKNLQDMVQNGSFNALIDSIINPNNEVNNLPVLLDLTDSIKEIALDLSSSLTVGQKHLSYDQVIQFNNLNKTMYKLYKEFNSGILEATREQAESLIGRAKEVKKYHSSTPLKNRVTAALFDALSPKEIIAFMCGGTHTESFNTIYNELYKKPYEAQVGKYVDFLLMRDEHIKALKKQQHKTIRVNGVKMKKYVLYQFYLNTLSPDNTIRMKNSNLSYTMSGGTTKTISYQSLLNATNELLTEAEITDLNAIFALYNNEVKDYVEEMSQKILGFKVSRENYYPIIGSEAFKTKDFSNPSQIRFNINALNNGRLKKLSNRKTVIEININPINLFNSYIESMTITGEIGLQSQKLNRLFQLKNSEGESFATIVSDYVPHATDVYIPSIFNKLIGNTQTIERTAFLDKLQGKFATATLGANVRSILKQFGSYFTAWEKVGITTGLKSMLSPTALSRIYKNRKYLKENNNVFKLRIYENGFIRGATLSAGAAQFTSTVGRKLVEFSLKGMEAMDRLTCYATFTLAEEYIKKTHGHKIGSEENLKLANEMWTDMILETQSNSDRIAMSRIRSGEKGAVTKNLFGIFQSDAQNKAGLLVNVINDSNILSKELEKLKSELANAKSESEKAAVQKRIDALTHERSQTHTRARAFFAGLILSGLITTLADMVSNWIYDKEEPEDAKFISTMLELVANTTFDWIPYFNQIFNWIQYDGVDMPMLQGVNGTIEVIKSFLDGNATREDFIHALIQLATLCGFPIKNINKLVSGVLGNFNPKEALRYRNLLYGLSQSYLGTQTNENIAKGHLDKANAALSLNYSLYKFNVSGEVAEELVEFKVQGINCSIKNSITYYLDENGGKVTMNSQDIKLFQDIYSGANEEIKKLLRDNNYQKLSMEDKAKAVKKLADVYFDIAKYKTLRITPTTKLSLLAYKSNVEISQIIMLMSELQSKMSNVENKKSVLLKELNKVKNTKAEKLLISILMGYAVSEENKNTVITYLIKLGFTRTEAEEFL